MALIVPPASNYPSPLVALPSFVQDEPVEGRRQVTCDVPWSMSDVNRCIAFDLGKLSQLSTLKVDNSACGADVKFVFPDGDDITIPARSPLVVVPVFSNSTQFWLLSPFAEVSDVTRFIGLNYEEPPTQTAKASNQVFIGSITDTWLNGTVVTQFVPATENGTLLNLLIVASFNTGFPTDSEGQFTVSDGAGNVLIPAWKMFSGPSSVSTNAVGERFRGLNLNVRFQLGLIVTFSVVTVWSGVVNMNALCTYRKP